MILLIVNLIITELAFWLCRSMGGHPPKGRWNMGQFSFWKYIKNYSNDKLMSYYRLATTIHVLICITFVILIVLVVAAVV
jgi:uncharacterized metal-binding protein